MNSGSDPRPGGEEPEAAGFVLAGGLSSRMGADKALELLDGRPLVAWALSVLRQAGLRASIAGALSSLTAFAPLVEDSQPGRGPLGGICAALDSTAASLSVFVPVDLPLLPPSLLVHLVGHAQVTGRAVTLCSANGFAQTFPAVVSRAALPVLAKQLESGEGGCLSAFQSAASRLEQPMTVLPVEYLVQTGHATHPQGLPAALWFLNVNAPQDLRRAEHFLRGSRRVS